jgi:hypothetical protein
MLDQQPAQTLFENMPLNINPMAYVSLDSFFWW